MKVYEYGKEQKNTVLIFQCAAEPWWAFEKSAEALAHAELVMMFPEQFRQEVLRFWNEE